MPDGKDLVRVELAFHKMLPTIRLYKKGAESRRQPLLARASPQLRPDRRADRRQHADSRRQRRRHHQPSRHYRTQHLPPSDTNASHRQLRSRHHLPSCNLHLRLLLQFLRPKRSQGPSHRRLLQPLQRYEPSTFASRPAKRCRRTYSGSPPHSFLPGHQGPVVQS